MKTKRNMLKTVSRALAKNKVLFLTSTSVLVFAFVALSIFGQTSLNSEAKSLRTANFSNLIYDEGFNSVDTPAVVPTTPVPSNYTTTINGSTSVWSVYYQPGSYTLPTVNTNGSVLNIINNSSKGPLVFRNNGASTMWPAAAQKILFEWKGSSSTVGSASGSGMNGFFLQDGGLVANLVFGPSAGIVTAELFGSGPVTVTSSATSSTTFRSEVEYDGAGTWKHRVYVNGSGTPAVTITQSSTAWPNFIGFGNHVAPVSNWANVAVDYFRVYEWVDPTNTPTNTPIPPTATATSLPGATDTATPIATDTGVPPTETATGVPPTATATGVPPADTATATSTAVPPTETATVVPPTATSTATAVPPTSTATAVPPTNTATATATATATSTSTSTATATPVTPAITATATQTVNPSFSATPTATPTETNVAEPTTGGEVTPEPIPGGIPTGPGEVITVNVATFILFGLVMILQVLYYFFELRGRSNKFTQLYSDMSASFFIVLSLLALLSIAVDLSITKLTFIASYILLFVATDLILGGNQVAKGQRVAKKIIHRHK